MALDIIRARLRNQRLTGVPLATPADVVRWLGAVQAQEYEQSKWGLALRSRRSSDAEIERAFNAGAILRTHVMRPTWHFVAPTDIRWLLALTGPRVSARMAPYNRKLELDATLFRKSEKAIVNALRGGVQLTRQELKVVLQRAGVRADGVQRLAHLTMQAEIDAVICSGERRGTQFTYALLDERVPAFPARSRDDALAELTRRYFGSHGPAQLQDFTWWSGLTVADARRGLEMVASELTTEIIDERTYWFSETVRERVTPEPAHLLGLYDEYLIAYKDRSACLDRSAWSRVTAGNPFLAPLILDGLVVGGWKRADSGGDSVLRMMPLGRPGHSQAKAVAEAARRYVSFIGQEPELVWT